MVIVPVTTASPDEIASQVYTDVSVTPAGQRHFTFSAYVRAMLLLQTGASGQCQENEKLQYIPSRGLTGSAGHIAAAAVA